MNYKFPHIEHIDQVREAIVGRDDFIEAKKDGYTVFNYLVRLPDSFPDPATAPDEVTARHWAIRRECRGITFDAKGNIAVRPFQKFFNVGEMTETFPENINLSNPHVIMDKYDGSMIKFFKKGDNLICHTKMGETEISSYATAFVANNLNYLKLATELWHNGYTGLYEFCSLKNRVVVTYPEDRLVLLAVRHNVTGEYMDYNEMKELANRYNVEYARVWDSVSDIGSFIEKVKGETDSEGYIIRFADGHSVKIKNDWYCLIHKTKDELQFEKDVLRLCVTNAIDDIIPHLDSFDRERLENYNAAVMANMTLFASQIEDIVNEARNKNLTSKEFAVNVASKHPYSSLLFFVHRGLGTGMEAVIKHVEKNTVTSTKVEGLRPIIGNVEW